jgi:nitrogen regulatory protein P-II 1
MTITKIEAIIQPSKLQAVKEALINLDIGGMTISEVYGHGRREGQIGVFRGHQYKVDLLPNIKLEMVLLDDQVEDAVDAIVKNSATGKIGDGKIFLSRIDDIVRIRNQQRGVAAL